MRIPQRLRREDGAAAVEFALIVGVLAMLIFGMLQFGLTFFELQNLRAAAREGGRLGAVDATPDAIRDKDRERVERSDLAGGSEQHQLRQGLVLRQRNVHGIGSEPDREHAPRLLVEQRRSRPMPPFASQMFIANAPAHLKSLFTLNIPLLPTITHDADDRRPVPMRRSEINTMTRPSAFASLTRTRERGATVVIVALVWSRCSG